MASTAASWRRHASAQMIVKPAAIPGICGARKATPPAASVSSSSGHRRLTTVKPGRCSGIIVAALASASSLVIGGLVAARRPSHRPKAAASTHQPAMPSTRPASSMFVAPATQTTASRDAAAPLSRTVTRRKSTNRIRGSAEQRLQELAHAARAVDEDVGAGLDLVRRLVGAHADAQRVAQPPRGDLPAQAVEGVEVGAVVADVDRGVEVGVAQQPLDAAAL